LFERQKANFERFATSLIPNKVAEWREERHGFNQIRTDLPKTALPPARQSTCGLPIQCLVARPASRRVAFARADRVAAPHGSSVRLRACHRVYGTLAQVDLPNITAIRVISQLHRLDSGTHCY